MRTPRPAGATPPRVLVLLATHNGLRWLPEQVDSILTQEGVDVRIVAMDDRSTDGTPGWLSARAKLDERFTLLPDDGTAGSAAANFYRLILSAERADDELLAFADQDDIWQQGKLARHARLIEQEGFDGISSNVTSFSPRGERALVRKDFPQRRFDYLLESPGPGCSFMLTPRLAALIGEVIRPATGPARSVEFHDSLIYAIARAHGWRWRIDSWSSVDYRQHDQNVFGSNIGLRPALERLRLVRNHWLRNHAILLANVSVTVAAPESLADLEYVLGLLSGRGARSRLKLARLAVQLRRRPRDQRIIALLIAIGIW